MMGIDIFLSIVLCIIGILLMFTISTSILVVIGNTTVTRWLARLGFAVFSNKIDKDFNLLQYINKDGIGWLDVPNVCYAPVMGFCDGKYRDLNFLSKESLSGEIFLLEGGVSENLRLFANKSNNVFRDLSILNGSAHGSATDLRKANFSHLHRLSKAEGSKKSIVTVYDNNRERKFKLLCFLDIGFEDLHCISISSRDNFLDMIQKLAGVKPVKVVADVLILQCKTDINNLMLFLEEI